MLTRELKRKRERKKSILEGVSKLPTMETQARLATLGAATKRKNTGRSMAGIPSPPANL